MISTGALLVILSTRSTKIKKTAKLGGMEKLHMLTWMETQVDSSLGLHGNSSRVIMSSDLKSIYGRVPPNIQSMVRGFTLNFKFTMSRCKKEMMTNLGITTKSSKQQSVSYLAPKMMMEMIMETPTPRETKTR